MDGSCCKAPGTMTGLGEETTAAVASGSKENVVLVGGGSIGEGPGGASKEWMMLFPANGVRKVTKSLPLGSTEGLAAALTLDGSLIERGRGT